MPDITEEDLKANGEALFTELEGQIKQIETVSALKSDCRRLIHEGKTLLKGGDTAEALKRYLGAREKLEEAISDTSEPLAKKLLWAELAYLAVLLVVGYVTYKWPTFGLWNGLINQSLQTAWFGALGGVTVAIYGIYTHVQQKNFDPNFKLWYLCKPIIGAIFGWFVYLIFLLGFVSIQGVNQGQMTRPELPFLIAFLAGFSERFTIKLIDKLMSVLTSFENDAAKVKGKQKQ